MDLIHPEKWSAEWYQLTTSDELVDLRKHGKEILKKRPKSPRERVWANRVLAIEEELERRKDEMEEWQDNKTL